MFEGVTTALVTPFVQGRVSEEGLRENVRFQIREGVGALLCLGTTGEGGTLSEEERCTLLRVVVKEGKGTLPLLVSCGDLSTEGVIHKIGEVEKYGGDGILVISPYYCRPSQEGLFRHFEKIAKRTSLPILLYNHPARSGVTLEVDTVVKLAQFPHIIGIKDASKSVEYGAAIMHALPHFLFLAGDDLMTLPLKAIGSQGVISVLSNLLPRHIGALWKGEAPSLYRLLYPLMALSQLETNPIPIKAMMDHMGLPAGECRLPLTPLSLPHQKKLVEGLSTSPLLTSEAYA